MFNYNINHSFYKPLVKYHKGTILLYKYYFYEFTDLHNEIKSSASLETIFFILEQQILD